MCEKRLSSQCDCNEASTARANHRLTGGILVLLQYFQEWAEEVGAHYTDVAFSEQSVGGER